MELPAKRDPDAFLMLLSTHLFQVAKLIAENIVLVSLCPRLDDASGNIRRGNIIIKKLANDENCKRDTDAFLMLLSTLTSPVSGVFCSSVSGTVTRFVDNCQKPLSD
jgi:hypothetical protein